MGMSASQARYLALTSRMNDIEYQGQQINQQRTTLASQINALYNSLLEMDVPTPPSKQDFTKIVYKGYDNASAFSIDNIIPHGTEYSIDFKYTKTGHAIQAQGTATASYTPANITLAPVENVYTPATEAQNAKYECTAITDTTAVPEGATIFKLSNNAGIPNGTSVFILNGGQMEKVKYDSETMSGMSVYQTVSAYDYEGNPQYIEGQDFIQGKKTQDAKDAVPERRTMVSDITSVYISSPDGTVRPAEDTDFEWINGFAYYKKDMASNYLTPSASGSEYKNPNYTENGNHQYQVAGKPCYSLEEAYSNGAFTDLDEYNAIQEAITNAYPDKKPEDFVVYFTSESGSGKQIPHFVAIESFNVIGTNSNGTKQVTYCDYIANGQYTAVENHNGCKLEFDNAGRITSVQVPRYDDAGNLTGYTKLSLEATEETNTDAYEEAFNDYEYAKHKYDKQQQEINAQTSIIQAEDKNLELKLTRLDNERNAVKTELDAVKKVIDENIEKSYKTFSG